MELTNVTAIEKNEFAFYLLKCDFKNIFMYKMYDLKIYKILII